MGTRSIYEISRDARGLCYSEDYSKTEGWDDNKVAVIANLGLRKLYRKITEVDQPANIEQVSINSVAGTPDYDIPIDVHMGIRLHEVRFIWGAEGYNFIPLEQTTIGDRVDYQGLYPQYYCIRDGQIIITPTPSITRVGAIQINYQKRMRTLDFIRGKVSSILGAVVDGAQVGVNTINVESGHDVTANSTVQLLDRTGTTDVQRTVSSVAATTITISGDPVDVNDDDTIRVVNPMTIKVSFPNDSIKWNKMSENSEELDYRSHICIVDRDGTPIASEIPIDSFDTGTEIITMDTNYTMPLADMTSLDQYLSDGKPLYIVYGKYASTHSELDGETEDYFMEFIAGRLLRLQGNTAQSREQMITEKEVLDQMVTAYKRYRKSVYPVQYTNRLRNYAAAFSTRGLF